MLEIASEQKADIFITPECWLDGYAAPDKKSTPEKLREIAQPLEGSKYLERVAAEAKKRSMYICFGFSSLEDGKIYNASGLWDNQGKLVRRLSQNPPANARPAIRIRPRSSRLGIALGPLRNHDLC